MKFKIKKQRKVPIEISIEGRIVAFDTETTGLRFHHGDAPFAFSFTDYEGNDSYIRGDVDPFTRKVSLSREDEATIVEFLEDATITKVMHNAKFDIGMCEQYFGCKVKGKIIDTMIFAHVWDSSRPIGLKPLCNRVLNISEQDQKDLQASVVRARAKGKKAGYTLSSDVKADYHLGDPELCKQYAVTDTQRTMQLFWFFEEPYNEGGAYKELVDMEHKVLMVTKRMEDRGVGIDWGKCIELTEYYEDTKSGFLDLINVEGYGDVNLNSPKQLAKVFYEDKLMPPIYRTRKSKDKGRAKSLTTDSKALQHWASLGDTFAKCIIAYREADHQLKNFVSVFMDEGKKDKDGFFTLHPNYRTCGPITARLSCTTPNLMNISNPQTRESGVSLRARECFTPRGENTVLYFTDYSQVEVWVSMFLSKDEAGMKALLDNEDMHKNMALKLWSHMYDFSNPAVLKKWRKRAKFCLFGLIYGAGVGSIMDTAGCGLDEAKKIIRVFWDTYPGLHTYSKQLSEEAEINGYVTGPYGRRYHVTGDDSYKALNYMIQGTAAEVMKRALISIDKALTFRKPKKKFKKAKLLLTIHDETGVEADKRDKAVPKLIVEAMSGEFHKMLGMPVRLKADVEVVTTNWAEKEKLDPQPVLKDIT